MIKNFNFYDIYGYFLPGLVLLTLFAIPLLLLEPRWPTTELSSAIAFLALAYIAGHILQTVAAAGIPSYKVSRVRSETVFRFPSETLLDSSDSTFSTKFKTRLEEKIKTFFKLDVGIQEVNEKSSPEDVRKIGKRRQEAFFICRSALVAQKQNVYGEQFEGMYTLMRGLTAAFWFGAAYYFGWALSTEFPGLENNAVLFAGIMLFLAAIVSLASTLPQKDSAQGKIAGYFILIMLYIAIIPVGAIVAFRHGGAQDISGLLWLITLCSFLAGIRSYNSFRTFAGEFAKAIYRDFYVYEKNSKPNEVAGSNVDER